ncbi:MAG: hydantoinase/oxoprolinase family protein [Bacteroidota bacterium]
MSYLIGIDVGGTFTDFSCFDTEKRELFYHKVISTPDDPSRAIVNGIREILERRKIVPKEISYLAHGTTVATNALIQGKGGSTGLITTNGFKDLLEIGRQTRPSLYELDKINTHPLVPGKLRCEVRERMLYDGTEYEPLDETNTREVVRYLKAKQVKAIAVCTLFSFVNPAHEQRIEQIISEEFPDAYVSVSHKVVPEFREYSRMSTTVINAFLGPVMQEYVTNFQQSIQGLGIKATPYITQSNGSIISIQEARNNPVRTILSGPSAGVIAAGYVASKCGVKDIITFDMGGTSADISLISGGNYKFSAEKNIEGYVVRLPMVDIETIGAGGGSIAYIDEGGAMKVGPQSAGAKPGPAAYNRGGTQPTVTDANIVLGRINPERILGGRMEIHRDLAEQALKRGICDKTGMDLFSAAKGIIAVVNSNMVRAIRIVSVERGYDVREFALVAFGGAGPLHACEIAQELGIRTIVIPPSPGTLSSLGLVVADAKYDYVKTAILDACESNLDKIQNIFDELEALGRDFLQSEHIEADAQRFMRRIEARYKMQNYELSIPVQSGAFDAVALSQAIGSFHAEHEKNYGYHNETQPIQFVNFHLTAIGEREKPELHGQTKICAAVKPVAFRPAYFSEDTGYISCPIYSKDTLSPNVQICGPAIIEQMDTTIVIMPRWIARLDRTGTLCMDYGERRDMQDGSDKSGCSNR